MTLRVLKAQADKIAALLKAASRGEKIATVNDPIGADKLAAALKKDAIKFAVVMDDKILTIEMPWATIRTMSEVAISEWVMKQMREKRNDG